VAALIDWQRQMSPRLLAVRLVIGLKRAAETIGLRRCADVYVECIGEWRYPVFLLRALRRCDVGVIEVPSQDALASWGADGFWNFMLRTRLLPAGTDATAPVVIAREPDAVKGEIRSRVRISVDWFSEDARRRGLLMPYFAHPNLQRLDVTIDRSRGERPVRIGFAGTLDQQSYREKFVFPMLGRFEVLQRVQERFDRLVALAESQEALAAVDPSATPVVLVIVRDPSDTTRKHILEGPEYLSFLGECSFFLAPPGFRMPFCHNLVEAMSVGAIPILGYGGWLDPPLRDGVDALRFSTLDDLDSTIERALAANEDEIRRLRTGVLAYYDEHLSIDSFARRLCPRLHDSPTIVVNSERDTAALWRKRATATAR
jgi:hypothetical protein